MKYFLALFCIFQVTCDAQEWGRFRGPNGSGVSDTELPVKWTSSNYKWKVALPGTGHGCPVLYGNKVFINGSWENGKVRMVICADAESGKILWQKEFPFETHKKHKQNSFASSTPTVDEDGVYSVRSKLWRWTMEEICFGRENLAVSMVAMVSEFLQLFSEICWSFRMIRKRVGAL